MKKSILVVGFACLSMIAVAQSTSDNKTAPASTAPKRGISSPTGGDRTVSPRDSATGQASGKRLEVTHTVASPRDTVSGQATGRRVAAGDVNGDGAAAQPAVAKEVSTGKATGKTMASDDWQAPAAAKGPAANTGAASGNAQQQRMHKPVAVTK
jgi:hypothetical protein